MQTLVPLLISWLLEVEDDPGWHTFDEDFSVTNAQVAEQGLDRLSLCMGFYFEMFFVFNLRRRKNSSSASFLSFTISSWK